MSKEVTMYTQNNCPQCDLLKVSLDNNGVTYTIKNIEENEEYKKEVLALGAMGTPFTLVGDTQIPGNNYGAIMAALSE